MGAISNANSTLPGATITSSGGATTLPAASAGDFASADNPLSSPDQTYPSLELAHVAVFRATGTPEEMIAQIAAEKPDPATIDAYITDEIMQNPEAWDQRTGQRVGTTRAGLTQLMPGQPLGGRPQATGVAPPAIFTPTATPAPVAGGGGGGGLMTTLLVGGAALGIGVGATLFLKNRSAAKAAEAGARTLGGLNIQQLGMMAPGASALGAVGGIGAQGAAHGAFGVVGGTGMQLHNFYTANMANLAIQAGDPVALQQSVLLQILGNSNLPALDKVAAMQAIMEGKGVVDPTLARIYHAGQNYGVAPQEAMDGAIRLGIGDKLDSTAIAKMMLAAPAQGAPTPAPSVAQLNGALDDLMLRMAFLRGPKPTA